MAKEATMRIPLAEAYFCENCQCFVDSAIACECGSEALLCMSGVMNRKTEPEPEEVSA